MLSLLLNQKTNLILIILYHSKKIKKVTQQCHSELILLDEGLKEWEQLKTLTDDLVRMWKNFTDQTIKQEK